jgi:hypothetical protein
MKETQERNTGKKHNKETHTKKHTKTHTKKHKNETHKKQSPRTPDRLLLYFVTMDITNVWSVWYSGTGQGIPARCMRIKFRYSLLLHIFKALVVLMCLNFAFAYLESPSTVFIFCFVHQTRREKREKRTERDIDGTSGHETVCLLSVHCLPYSARFLNFDNVVRKIFTTKCLGGSRGGGDSVLFVVVVVMGGSAVVSEVGSAVGSAVVLSKVLPRLVPVLLLPTSGS